MQTFGELRLKRFVFEKVGDKAMAEALDAHEQEVLGAILPPAPTPPKRRANWLKWLGLAFVGLAAVAGGRRAASLAATDATHTSDASDAHGFARNLAEDSAAAAAEEAELQRVIAENEARVEEGRRKLAQLRGEEP